MVYYITTGRFIITIHYNNNYTTTTIQQLYMCLGEQWRIAYNAAVNYFNQFMHKVDGG